MDWFDSILWPLKVAVAWIMVQFHTLFTSLGMAPDSGLTWTLAIVGLVVLIRILLIPLFVKQIKASRGMQALAPEMQAIQKKYKGKKDPASREAMSRETMELYRKHGTNPFSSCLPILAQSPIFFALFRVLYSLPQVEAGTYADGTKDSIGPLTQELAAQANAAELFGAKISETFLHSGDTQVKIVAVVLILLMSATTFTTQRQLTRKNMPAAALEGPMAQQQKMLLYVLPLVFAISGVNFPIGVLIYWTTTNLWSMGQQFYVIRRNPTPGSEADRLLKERRAKRAAARGIVLEEDKPEPIEEKPRGQREQPKRKDRAKSAGGATQAGPRQSAPRQVGGKPGTPAQGGAKQAGAKGSAKAGGPASGSVKPTAGGAKGGPSGARKPGEQTRRPAGSAKKSATGSGGARKPAPTTGEKGVSAPSGDGSPSPGPQSSGSSGPKKPSPNK